MPQLRRRPAAFRTALAATLLTLMATSCVQTRYGHVNHRPVDPCEVDNDIGVGLHVVAAFFHLASALTN